MSTKNVLVGIFAGFATGAIVGVLLAPAKGSITRKRIAQKAVNHADDVKERFNEYVDAISEKYASIKGDAVAWAEKGKDNSSSSEA